MASSLCDSGRLFSIRSLSKKKNAADKSDQMPYLTKDKEAHYRELGLSPQEIDFSEVQ